MLRTTSNILNAKALWSCRCSRDFQLSSVNYVPKFEPPIRKTYQSEAPPPATKGTYKDKLPWGGLAAFILAGYGITFAHESPEFRDTLSLHAPWLDELIAFLYQENMTYQEFIVQLVLNVKKSVVNYIQQVDFLPVESRQQKLLERKSIKDVPDKTKDV